MSLFKRAKKMFEGGSSEEKAADPLADVRLDKLDVGYLVDYDYKTWQVTDHVRYDYEGFLTDEWKHESEDDTCFLELEDDDAQQWAIWRKLSIAQVEHAGEESMGRYLERQKEPPATVRFEGEAYELEETGPAVRIERDGDRQRLTYWSYTGGVGALLAIERYGEATFEAAQGRAVEPYEFDNILPSGR